jgi:hypothetical protein
MIAQPGQGASPSLSHCLCHGHGPCTVTVVIAGHSGWQPVKDRRNGCSVLPWWEGASSRGGKASTRRNLGATSLISQRMRLEKLLIREAASLDCASSAAFLPRKLGTVTGHTNNRDSGLST